MLKLSIKERLLEIFLLLCVISASFFVRWDKIGSIPNGIEGDEISMVLNSFFHAKGFEGADFGIWSVHDINARDFPVSYIINQVGFLLFGNDFFSARKMLAITSSIALLFFYLTLRRFVSSEIALLTLLLYAFSAYMLTANRVVHDGYAYADIFVFASLFLLVSSIRLPMTHQFIVSFFAGIVSVLSLLTYIVSFLFPLIAIVFICTNCIEKNKRINKVFLLSLLFFIIPIVPFKDMLTRSFSDQLISKAYLEATASLAQFNLFSFLSSIPLHFKTSTSMLFNFSNPNICDMQICWNNATLIHPVITILALCGFIISCIHFKRYSLLCIYFLVQFIGFNIILGFNFPRMWILTIGIFYMLSALSLEELKTVIHRQRTQNWIIIFVCLLFVSFIISLNQISIFKSAMNNNAYEDKIREAYDSIVYQKSPIRNVIFLDTSDEKIKPITVFASFDREKNLFHKEIFSFPKAVTLNELDETIKEKFLRNEWILLIVKTEEVNDVDHYLTARGYNNYSFTDNTYYRIIRLSKQQI